jgi:hypothetical protein
VAEAFEIKPRGRIPPWFLLFELMMLRSFFFDGFAMILSQGLCLLVTQSVRFDLLFLDL